MYIPSKKLAERIVAEYGTPVFVTDAHTIRERSSEMVEAFSDLPMKIFYAIKANFNPHIVRIIQKSGIYGIDAVSPNEIRLALELGYTPEHIIFTPSNPSDEEIRYAGDSGVLQNLGSLSELRRFGKMFPGAQVSIRISPEVGAGECAKVTTGDAESKFGITFEQLDEVRTIVKKHRLHLVGIHSHIGSGFYRTKEFVASVKAVCDVARTFPEVTILDFGGGFGVEYHPDRKGVALASFARAMAPVVRRFERDTGRAVELRIEPGKYLVTQSTALLVRTTTLKEKKDHVFVGVDAGLNTLIRPAMYDAYHHIVNVSRPRAKRHIVQVAGNVCESCDVFNKKIALGVAKERDILALLCSGGYGSAMSSLYTMRPFAPEVLIDGNTITLTRKRQSYEEMMGNFIPIEKGKKS